jgi:acetyl esterase/lipase
MQTMKWLLCLIPLMIHPVAAQRGLPEGTKVEKNIAYVTGGHERQTLDIFVPPHAENEVLPVVIWIHGGAWMQGSKENCQALPLLGKGYAVVSINYRLSQHAVFPAQIEDCKAAVRWVRAHAKEKGIDPKHVGVWGSSAGGHLVALLGTSGDKKEWEKGENLDVSSRPDAVCNYFGVADLTTIVAQSNPKVGPINHAAPDSPESKLIGAPITENREKAAVASPATYVSKDDPTMLLVHGTKDPLVPYQQSVDLCAALKKVGVGATLHPVDGAGHGNGFGLKEAEAVLTFFDSQLKEKK